jgi:ubiquinone/menaquinone biosynthesis C-methylase UbiE
VIDIGCGCGDTSIEIARTVGAAGSVLGIDVSQPMLEVARSRSALANCAHLAFREGDASEAWLPANIDLLFSRFGVMFFSQPSPAFSHLRKSLRAGGRYRDRSTRKLRDHRVPARRAQAAEKLYLPDCHLLLFRRVTADSDDVEQAIGCGAWSPDFTRVSRRGKQNGRE